MRNDILIDRWMYVSAPIGKKYFFFIYFQYIKFLYNTHTLIKMIKSMSKWKMNYHHQLHMDVSRVTCVCVLFPLIIIIIIITDILMCGTFTVSFNLDLNISFRINQMANGQWSTKLFRQHYLANWKWLVFFTWPLS